MLFMAVIHKILIFCVILHYCRNNVLVLMSLPLLCACPLACPLLSSFLFLFCDGMGF